MFRRNRSPYRSLELNLRALDPAATYEVTEYRTYQPEPVRKFTGTQLQTYLAEVPETPGSLLLEYQRVP